MIAGKPEEAIPIYQELVRAVPNNPELVMNLCIADFKAKRYKDAIEQAEVALKLQPDMANAWLFLGISLFDLNEPARAVVPLRRYTSSRRDDAEGHYYLGISLLGLENFGDAVRELLEARRIDPRNEEYGYAVPFSSVLLAFGAGEAGGRQELADSLRAHGGRNRSH